MSLGKYRVCNKTRIIIMIIFFISLFIAFFCTSGLYSLTFGFDLSAPDIAADPRGAQQLLISQKTTMDSWADVYTYLMIVLPILSFGLSILFFQEKTGMFSYLYTRGKSYKKVVLSSMFSHAALNGLYFYVAYLIYFTIGYFAFGPDLNLARTNLDGIFGANFCADHTYLYFVIEGFFLYFVASFIYTLFACAVGMLTSRAYQMVLIPACFYFGASLLIGYILPLNGWVVNFFQPFKFVYFSLIAWQPISPLNLLEAVTPLVLPLLIAATLIIIGLKKGERTNA